MNKKLVLEGATLDVALMLIRDAAWRREGILARLKKSNCSTKLRELVIAADDSLHELEVAIGRAWAGEPIELVSAALVKASKAFRQLAMAGWGTIELMAEGERYEPVVEHLNGNCWRYQFYNPASGFHDLSVDKGWTRGGLPPLK